MPASVTDPRASGVVRSGDASGRASTGSPTSCTAGRSPGTVRLRRLGAGGFAIKGLEDTSAAGAGDVNGDGFADVIVAAGDRSDGGAYVVFGAPRRRSFDAARLGRRGFAVHGAPGDQQAGPVAGAGDVNGDGLDDLVIGAPSSLGAPPPRDAREAFGGAPRTWSSGSARTPPSAGRPWLPDRAAAAPDRPRRFRGGRRGRRQRRRTGRRGRGRARAAARPPSLPVGPGSAFVVFGAPTPDTVTLGEALERAASRSAAAQRRAAPARPWPASATTTATASATC